MNEIDKDIRVTPLFAWIQVGLGIVSAVFLAPAVLLTAIAGFLSWSLSEMRNGPPDPAGPAGMLVVIWLLMIILGLLFATSGIGGIMGIIGLA